MGMPPYGFRIGSKLTTCQLSGIMHANLHTSKYSMSISRLFNCAFSGTGTATATMTMAGGRSPFGRGR